MTASVHRIFERLALLALALSLFAGLASCGSGAVSGAPAVNDPTRITVLPGTGSTLYAGQPTTFTFSGGTGSYIVSSSNQAVIPVSGSLKGNTLTVVPNPVIADTDVTITVRDTGSTPIQTAIVTVKPGTVNNDILITPSSTQGTLCPTGTLCSGGDAAVSVTLSQGGIALTGRTVRFDAVSGDFRFISSPTGVTPELLATSVFVVTDESGRATTRIRATTDAPNQTAILQATDVSSGAFRRTAFIIAQATGTSPGFVVTPTEITFTGPRADQCASNNIAATVFIFGGSPPYTVSSTSSALIVSRDTVSFSGGSFTVSPNGQCVTDAPIIVRDSAGRTATVTVSNVRGTDAVPPLTVSPDTVNLSSCSSVATVIPAGGTGNYVASSGSGALVVSGPGQFNSFTIRRNPNSPATTSPLHVGIADGVSTADVTVTLTGGALGACSTAPFAAQPQAVSVTSCGGAAQVFLSGGTGNYNATSNNSNITATVSGSIVSIARAHPSALPQGAGITVSVTDGVTTYPISVTDTAGSCP